MKFALLTLFLFVNIKGNIGQGCGCKIFRSCYSDMLQSLSSNDEAQCIKDAAIGSSTLLIFLKALEHFCGDYISISGDSLTHESRRLYEVTLPKQESENDTKPVIMLEAGQEAGTSSVGLALYVLEQLMACSENDEMIKKIRWVILPCTNPDGWEYTSYRPNWRKNVKKSDNEMAIGVDISRNFNCYWDKCKYSKSTFAEDFPGPSAESEKETVFVQNVIKKHKNNLMAYVSIRRDGHSLLYPYASSESEKIDVMAKVAAEIASKVNQRVNGMNIFLNDSIYNVNGKPHCGHSVDYAYNAGARLAFEMRVFFESGVRLVNMFQPLPKGNEESLRSAYYNAIKTLFQMVTNEKKYNITLEGNQAKPKRKLRQKY